MIKDTTVVISCAGMGTRLGIGLPKALVKIGGEPLIIHQLKLLEEFDDIRIVVGFQAEKIIEIVKEYRNDITFVFNYEYEKTGPATSLMKALICPREKIISIGGDILINPNDFKKIMKLDECIAYTDKNSSEPTYINVEEGNVLSFGEHGNYEWQGILKIASDKLDKSIVHQYIYEMVNIRLPMKGIHVRSREIDNQDDYDNAVKFYNNSYR